MSKFKRTLNVKKSKVFKFRSPEPPDQGLCPWTPMGAPPSDPRYRSLTVVFGGGLQLSGIGSGRVYLWVSLGLCGVAMHYVNKWRRVVSPPCWLARGRHRRRFVLISLMHSAATSSRPHASRALCYRATRWRKISGTFLFHFAYRVYVHHTHAERNLLQRNISIIVVQLNVKCTKIFRKTWHHAAIIQPNRFRIIFEQSRKIMSARNSMFYFYALPCTVETRVHAWIIGQNTYPGQTQTK